MGGRFCSLGTCPPARRWHDVGSGVPTPVVVPVDLTGPTGLGRGRGRRPTGGRRRGNGQRRRVAGQRHHRRLRLDGATAAGPLACRPFTGFAAGRRLGAATTRHQGTGGGRVGTGATDGGGA
ncbi:hypothetical protein AWV63_29270 [Micromonospora rifamycinica]|nr:hypothetical protein AWV63_29270 [Micromonospora rifamycinica]